MGKGNILSKILIVSIGSVLILSVLSFQATAELVPDWVRNTAKWFGDGTISETEFLNAVTFLIQNDIIVIETQEMGGKISTQTPGTFDVILPPGNSEMANAGFYLPLNAEVIVGTTVIWVNEDKVHHTIQSQDEQGNVTELFSSDLLSTGKRFEHVFTEPGVYNYFCTIHPWRVGTVTVR